MGRLQLRAACGPLATLLFTYLTFAYFSIFFQMSTNAPQTPTTAAGMVASVITPKGHTSAGLSQALPEMVQIARISTNAPQTPTTAAGMVASVTTRKGHTSASVSQALPEMVQIARTSTNAPQTPTTAAGMVASVITPKDRTSASVRQDILETVTAVQVNMAFGYYKMSYFKGGTVH